MVYKIEELGSELKRMALDNSGSLENGEIPIVPSRAVENVAAQISESPCTRRETYIRTDTTEERIWSTGGRSAA